MHARMHTFIGISVESTRRLLLPLFLDRVGKSKKLVNKTKFSYKRTVHHSSGG